MTNVHNAGKLSSNEIYQVQLNRHSFQQWLEEASANDIMADFVSHACHAAFVDCERELTERQRLFFTEYHVNGRSIQEIADLYGVSKSTVSRTISRANEKLVRFVRYSAPHLMNAPMPTRNRRIKYGK